MTQKQIAANTIALAIVVTSLWNTAAPIQAREKEVRQNSAAVNRLVETADKEISRRLASMEKLIEQINQMKRITGNQKNELVKIINTEMANLRTIQSSLAKETNPQVLREYKKTIIDSYRVYALNLPKIAIIAYAERVLELVDKIAAETKTYEGKADAAKIAAINTNLDTARKKSQEAINLVMPLTSTNYPENKSQLREGRELLKQARTALMTAYADLKAVRLSLKTTNK